MTIEPGRYDPYTGADPTSYEFLTDAFGAYGAALERGDTDGTLRDALQLAADTDNAVAGFVDDPLSATRQVVLHRDEAAGALVWDSIGSPQRPAAGPDYDRFIAYDRSTSQISMCLDSNGNGVWTWVSLPQPSVLDTILAPKAYPETYSVLPASLADLQDASSEVQTALDSLSTNGGGVLYVSRMIRAANLSIPNNVSVTGLPGTIYGWTKSTGATGFRHPDQVTTWCLSAVVVTAGGSDYTSVPTVTITGGNGIGAAAHAIISDGSVTGIVVDDPGEGYTTEPTIAVTGGGGSGATASARVTSPILFKRPSAGHSVSLSFLTLLGKTAAPTSGVLLSGGDGFNLFAVNCYLFGREAMILSGDGGSLANAKIFGLLDDGAINLDYPSGALNVQFGCNDLQMSNLEVGAGHSGNQTSLNSAAFYYAGSAIQATNCVFEGADIGARLVGQNGLFTNCRADINYGHGWFVGRDVSGLAPGNSNTLLGCWAHRNSRYTTGIFDNFHIESGHSLIDTRLIGCRSSSSPSSDGWTHRYGLYDGAQTTQLIGFTDSSAAISWIGGGSAYPGVDNTSLVRGVQIAPSNVQIPDVTRLSIIRLSNTVPTLVTNFSGGVHGQLIAVQPMNGNTTFQHGGDGAIYTNTFLDKAAQSLRVYEFLNILGTWYEVGA